MIEDKATDRLKQRAQDLGLIINAGVNKPQPKSKIRDKERSDKKEKVIAVAAKR